MLRLTLIAVLLHLTCVVGQPSNNEASCSGPPVLQCNCGGDTSTSQPTNQPFNQGLRQGRPGKIGAPGHQGVKGEKGLKGEPGTPDDRAEQLQRLKEEVDELKKAVFSPVSCDYINGSVGDFGTYSISPLWPHLQALYVFCNFSNPTETIIHHSMTEELAANNCENPRCSNHKIKYGATMEQITALIRSSSSCKQFIKYRCVGSVLYQNFNPTYATWLSRDGTPQLYWGGATSRRDRYCACGETGSCVDSQWKCNCDRNTALETSDEGFLSDKDALPVTEIQVGDVTAPGERGWITLGPLICTGRSNP